MSLSHGIGLLRTSKLQHHFMPGLILERARVPVAPFFPGGQIENSLIVPAWHTEYFSHSNFYFLEKNFFFRNLNFISFGEKNYFRHLNFHTYI
jgi:hypothetical protein